MTRVRDSYDFIQLEEPTPLPTPDIELPAAASVESLRAATSALERRCGVLERLLDALVGHHRKTYSSIIYLGCSLLALMLAEIIRQSVKMERRLVVW